MYGVRGRVMTGGGGGGGPGGGRGGRTSPLCARISGVAYWRQEEPEQQSGANEYERNQREWRAEGGRGGILCSATESMRRIETRARKGHGEIMRRWVEVVQCGMERAFGLSRCRKAGEWSIWRSLCRGEGLIAGCGGAGVAGK